MLNTIIDTGPIVAFFDGSDKYSKDFRDYLKSFSGRLFSTLSVITEASYLLEDIQPAQLDLIEWVKEGAIQIVEISNADFQLIHKYMKKYKDTPMDFADASLVILGHKINTNNILTLDSDFDVYRTIEGNRFNNLISHLKRIKKTKNRTATN